MRTAELTGRALDWAVTKALGITDVGQPDNIPFNDEWWLMHAAGDMNFSTDWAQGGPIIEREGINLFQRKGLAAKEGRAWLAYDNEHPETTGSTPLIAAMRCYVASKLGDEVNVSEELIKD